MDAIVRLARHCRFCAFDVPRFGGTLESRARFNSAVFIAPDRRFLFTKNEKCGSNTARRTLQALVSKTPLPDNFSDTNRWMAPLLQPSDLDMEKIEDLNALVPFKFAIVRNPYSRLLSCYLNKFGPHAKKTRKFAKTLKADERIDFAEFVSRVSKQKPEDMDPHWRVQYHNIFCDRIAYDEFVRFEEYETQFGAILSRFSGAPAIRNVRKGAIRAEERLASYYAPDTARLVRDTFKIDFEYFGYSTELPA